MVKRFLFLSGFVFALVSCDNRTEYLKHDIELEKMGPCTEINDAVNIEANTIGERFVFEHCLNENDKEKSSVDRSHDTVFVKFVKSGNPDVRYKVTLDINTQPEYHFLSIDGHVFSINVKR